MNNVLLEIIEEIIELFEDEKVKTYAYGNGKFHIIDKKNNIDFQAKLGNNNYYFKDNISGISFIKVKKYINSNTTIQQILIEENNENCYYSYLERDGYVSLVKAVRVEGEDSLVCNNFNVLNHTWEEIAEYADECFENIDNLNSINAVEFEQYEDYEKAIAEMEDNEIYNAFGYEYETEDEYDDEDEYEYDYEDEYEDEYDDEYDDEYEYDNPDDYYDINDEYTYELKQIEDNERYGLSDVFEQNSIKDYETYIIRKEECEENGERYNQGEDHLPISEYSEAIDEYYSDYSLRINGNEIDGEAKVRIIADCEAAIDEKAFESNMFDYAAINLKSVIEAVQKRHEAYEK